MLHELTSRILKRRTPSFERLLGPEWSASSIRTVKGQIKSSLFVAHFRVFMRFHGGKEIRRVKQGKEGKERKGKKGSQDLSSILYCIANITSFTLVSAIFSFLLQTPLITLERRRVARFLRFFFFATMNKHFSKCSVHIGGNTKETTKKRLLRNNIHSTKRSKGTPTVGMNCPCTKELRKEMAF